MSSILPFGGYEPDKSSYMGASSQTIQNAVPRADGYGPFPDFSAFASELAEGNDGFTKILLQFNGADASTTMTDVNAGGSAHTWTANGNAQIDTAQSKFGGASLLCDGTGDYVSTPDHADFAFGSGDFTIDTWFNCVAVSGAQSILSGQMDNTASIGSTSFYIERQVTNTIRALFGVGAGNIAVSSATPFTNLLNPGWHHLAVTRSGTTLRLFVDGIQEGGNVSMVGTVTDSANALSVGRGGELVTASWNGWIDEFRLSVGVARWTSNFTPPLHAYGSATCRGFFYARKTDGSIAVFAGTSASLYKLDNSNLGWDDVSKGGAAYSALPSTDHWQFAQFGNFVIAVQANTVPQVFDLTSSSAFADLGGSPPQARYIAIVGRFVVLSGLLSTPYRIQWSGLNATTTWTPGVNSSDFQDLPDGGIVRGVAGGEYGVIFQETAMRRMIFVPGSPVIFNIERITEDKGLLAPYSLIRAGDKIFFLAAQGFQGMLSTGVPEAIGKERFDRTFFADYDSGSIQMIIGAADPTETRVYWAYKSKSGTTGQFDKVLCYDYALNRASIIGMRGEYLASLARPGLTLENLDSISSSLDALTFSLDDVSTAALSKLSAVNIAHKLGFFTGGNLEATLDTSEQATNGRRMRVKGIRPVTDAAICYGSVGARETLQEAVSYSAEQAVDAKGLCPANVSTRLARGRLRIPAAASWTFATGVEPEFVQEGRR